jgi:hypothetical protein
MEMTAQLTSDATMLLQSLRGRNVKLWIEEGQLRCVACKGSLSDEDLKQIRASREQLIEALTGGESCLGAAPAHSAVRYPIQIPVSSEQRFLWNLAQRIKNWPVITAHAVRLAGELDAQLIREGLNYLVRRHEALRTRIVKRGETPEQHIDPPSDAFVVTVDLTHLSLSEAEAHAKCKLDEFLNEPLDLESGPLFRVILISMSVREHVLGIGMHHLFTDRVTFGILFRELAEVYGQLLRGRAISLPPGPQYSDYVAWQQQKLPRWESRDKHYWATHLEGARCLQLPAEYSTGQPKAGASSMRIACEELSADVIQLAQSAQVLVPMVLLTSYAVVMSSLCKQKDFVIPFNVDGRFNPGHLSIAGYFAHFMCLRIRFTGDETFLEALRLVSREFYSGLEHDDCAKVINERPELMKNGVWQWVAERGDRIGGFARPDLTHPSGKKLVTSHYPFTLKKPVISFFGTGVEFIESEQGIRGLLFYGSVQQDAIQQLAHDLRAALGHFLRSPGALISSVPCAGPRAAEGVPEADITLGDVGMILNPLS